MGLEFRTAIVQFSFSNPAVLPDSVSASEAETKLESVARKLVAAGTVLVPPTENCYAGDLTEQLEAAGFELVDAFYQKRIDRRNPKRTYLMVRFVFAAYNAAHPSEDFLEKRGTVRADLQVLLAKAFWRVRAYDNLLSDGSRGLSINLEVRVTRFFPDGAPVTARQKDENGKKVGDPQPLQPSFRLLVGESVRLETITS